MNLKPYIVHINFRHTEIKLRVSLNSLLESINAKQNNEFWEELIKSTFLLQWLLVLYILYF
jgi:hypothetical protein